MTNETFYSFECKDIKGTNVPMEQFRGKAVLIVNVASKCGFTPQYKGLEEIYSKYKEKGFVVLGFPCNQFGGQEPGGPEDIQSFCSLTYGVDFPIFEKIEVNGANAHPLYQYLKKQATGILGTEAIKWNFTKFLIDREGKVVDRYAPSTTPADLTSEIEKLLP